MNGAKYDRARATAHSLWLFSAPYGSRRFNGRFARRLYCAPMVQNRPPPRMPADGPRPAPRRRSLLLRTFRCPRAHVRGVLATSCLSGASARSLFAEVLLIRGGSTGRHRPDLRRRRENGHTSRRRRMKLLQLPVLVFCARRALVSGGRLRYMIVRKPSISLPNRAPLRRGKLPPAPRFLSSAMFT